MLTANYKISTLTTGYLVPCLLSIFVQLQLIPEYIIANINIWILGKKQKINADLHEQKQRAGFLFTGWTEITHFLVFFTWIHI